MLLALREGLLFDDGVGDPALGRMRRTHDGSDDDLRRLGQLDGDDRGKRLGRSEDGGGGDI